MCYRPGGHRRRDLVWLSAALPGGVIAQAVAGGIVVLTRLNPAMVAVHFLLSSAILAAAVVLHARAGEGTGPASPLIRADLRILAALLAAATTLMLAAGTVVTGSGPLAGTVIDSGGRRTTVPRFGFPLQDVTQLHADIGWFIGALAIALVIGLRLTGAPGAAVRASGIVLAGLAMQAGIGYAQYFSHLPAGLVWVHVTTSVAVWIFVLRLYLSTRMRGPRPAESAVVATAAQPLPDAAPRLLSERIGLSLTRPSLFPFRPHCASRTPRNSAARALRPVSAPNTASPAVLRARACSAAVTPEMATTISLTTSVAW